MFATFTGTSYKKARKTKKNGEKRSIWEINGDILRLSTMAHNCHDYGCRLWQPFTTFGSPRLSRLSRLSKILSTFDFPRARTRRKTRKNPWLLRPGVYFFVYIRRHMSFFTIWAYIRPRSCCFRAWYRVNVTRRRTTAPNLARHAVFIYRIGCLYPKGIKSFLGPLKREIREMPILDIEKSPGYDPGAQKTGPALMRDRLQLIKLQSTGDTSGR